MIGARDSSGEQMLLGSVLFDLETILFLFGATMTLLKQLPLSSETGVWELHDDIKSYSDLQQARKAQQIINNNK